MRIQSVLVRSAGITGLAIAASCGSDTTSPTSASSAQLSAAIAQASMGDVSTYASARSLTNVPGAAAPKFDPAACAYASGDNSFTCPAKSVSGVNFQLKYFLYNASGVAMNAYDPAATDRLRTVWDATGTYTTNGAPSSSVQLNHHSDLTLTGLLGTTRTLVGTSSDHDVIDTGTGAGAAHAVIDVAGTASNIVLPAAPGQFPQSGQLAADISASTMSNAFTLSGNSRATLTFTGTNFATFTISSGGGVRECTIDLTGAPPPRC